LKPAGQSHNSTAEKGAAKEAINPKEAVERAGREVKQTVEKAKQMRPHEMLVNDVNLLRSYLMPGKQPDFHKKKIELIYIVIAFLWLTFYKHFLYRPDRGTGIENWKGVEQEVPEDKFDMMQPDFVLVFHHPDHKYGDEDTKVTKEDLRTTLVCRQRNESHDVHSFSRTHALVRNCSGGGMLSKLGSIEGQVESGSPRPDGQPTTLGQVRVALLQDIYMALSAENVAFDMNVFASVDGDELQVCIALHNEKTISRQLQLNSMKLQLQKRWLRSPSGSWRILGVRSILLMRMSRTGKREWTFVKRS